MGAGTKLARTATVLAATLGTTAALAQQVPAEQRRFGEIAAECVRMRAAAADRAERRRIQEDCAKKLLEPAPAVEKWVGTVAVVFDQAHSISLVWRSAAGPVELEITREPPYKEEFSALQAALKSVNARKGQKLAVTAKFDEVVFEVLDDNPSDIRLSFRITVPTLSLP